MFQQLIMLQYYELLTLTQREIEEEREMEECAFQYL